MAHFFHLELCLWEAKCFLPLACAVAGALWVLTPPCSNVNIWEGELLKGDIDPAS